MHPFREHRLCRLTPEELKKAKAYQDSIARAGDPAPAPRSTPTNATPVKRVGVVQKPLSGTTDAYAKVQNMERKTTMDSTLGNRVTIPGGLTQSQYKPEDVEPYTTPDGKTVYVPKGVTPTIAQPKAPLPTTSKVGPASTAYGAEDLKALATRRRNERLQLMGVDPTSEVAAILEKGGKLAGTSNGLPYFVMPDGSYTSTINNLNESTASTLSGQDFSIAGEEQRIKDEQAAATSSAASTEIENRAAAEQGAKGANTYQPDSADTSALESAIQALGPEYAFLLPALRAETAAAAAGEKAADKNLATDLAAADASQSAYDKVLDQMRTDAATIYSSAKEFTEENQRRSEEMLAKQQESVKDQLKWQEDKATRDLKKANDRRVNQLVAAQAIGGGFGSSNWVKTVAEAEWEGEQALADLTKEFGFKRADVSIAFTESMNKIYEVYGTQKLDAIKDFKSQLSTVNQYSFAATEKTEDRKTNARKEYQNTLASIADAQAKAIRDATKEVTTLTNQLRDDKRANEQIGLNMLDKMVDNYGSNIPQSLLQMVKRYLPDVNVEEVARARTLAQMKKGGGGTGGGSYTYGGETNASADAFYGTITKQQASEAIQRAFAPKNYGGTASERMTKINQYMARLNSGESPSAIMQSLSQDYWSSQKGAPGTAHTERVTAQGSAETLQSYVDLYGISADDDGPLGMWDSKMEGFKSWFGGSSEEYNNLAAQVGNIRARIIKENYGAAVTPQELTIAQSYIPSMDDKGANFITKLQNLKAYQAYLDAKVTADALGLPMPKPPTPVSLSGSELAGPGKYSADDISSALAD